MTLLGVVLAGGESRRFGGPKALARLHGRPLWAAVADRLASACEPVVFVANDPGVVSQIEGDVRGDLRPRLGPLGGFETALGWARDRGLPGVLVLAVDMPWVEAAALDRLVRAFDETGRACVPRGGARWGFEPLCAVIPVGVAPGLALALDNGEREAGAFLSSLDPVLVSVESPVGSFRSVNAPSDLPPPAVSVIGNKKSGKTTLAVGLISELTRRGRRVMSVKHGHHFRIDTQGTDSWRHRHEGGAERVLLAGPDEFAVMGGWGKNGALPLDVMLCRHLPDAEIVVTEGFRHAPLPKIEIFREGAQPEPILGPEGARAPGTLAVVTDRLDLPWAVPAFDCDGPDLAEGLADLVEDALL